MSKNKLFKELDLSHKPKRNGFGLGHNCKFTAKPGELLPVFHRTVMPGDHFSINVKNFTRTRPVNTAAMVQIREYFDFFFVPYRLLWKNAPQVHTDNRQNPVSATSPYQNRSVGKDVPKFSIDKYFQHTYNPDNGGSYGYLNELVARTNAFGYNRGYLSVKLLNYLGYGRYSTELVDSFRNFSYTPGTDSFTSGQKELCLYPLLAYQKIYYDFFRNTQWEDNQPYNYNVDYLGESTLVDIAEASAGTADYWDNPTMFDLRYSNYPKDLFFGVMPDSQFGDVAEVEVDGKSDSSTFYPVDAVSPQGNYRGRPELNGDESPFSDSYFLNIPGVTDAAGSNLGIYSSNILKGLKSSFDILQLRQAQYLQKYREILGSGAYDYKDRVRKLFGVDVPDTLTDRCFYLGGNSSDINISEVVNNNLSESEANIKGKGVGSGRGETIEFDAKEFGVIMCIYHAQPTIDYSTDAYHFDVTKVEVDDYANPVFDQLGFQELPLQYLTTSPKFNLVQNKFLGFTTRYFDYKTSVDRTLGDFAENLYVEGWIAPVNVDYLASRFATPTNLNINYNFFKVDPSILDPIFTVKVDSTTATDQLIVNSTFDINSVRPLDYFGVPYK